MRRGVTDGANSERNAQKLHFVTLFYCLSYAGLFIKIRAIKPSHFIRESTFAVGEILGNYYPCGGPLFSLNFIGPI